MQHSITNFSHQPVHYIVADCSRLGFPVLYYLPEFAQTHAHWFGDAIQPSHSLLSPSPPALSIRVFSSEFALCIRWSKYWSFSFNISPSSEYSGLISFRIDWFVLLAFQGTLKCLLQHHNSKASIFGAQPSLWSNSHICTWLLEKPQLSLYGSLSAKRCLCFLIRCLGLSRFSKEQVPFNFMAAVTVHIDFGAQDNKLFHCFHFSPSICHEMIGPYAMILDFWMLSIKPAFSLSSSPSSRSSLFLFTFCH